MRKESKHNPKERHQTTIEESKRRRKEQRGTTKQPKNNKMAISTYLSIITLNVNEINCPIKRQNG